MNIDWSKAPEGTTHCYPDSPEPWRDLSGENWKYFKHGLWHQMPNTSAGFLATSLGKVLFAKSWTGEGLPPVGTVCEFAGFNPEETTFDDPTVGDKVTVIAHYLSGCVQVAAFTYNCASNFGSLNVSQGAHGCFRPIRTPEQIAAEEREVTVKAMMSLNPDENPNQSLTKWLCEALYDAGYRKQVAP